MGRRKARLTRARRFLLTVELVILAMVAVVVAGLIISDLRAPASAGGEIFIDCDAGSDANQGSQLHPWRSLQPVQARVLPPATTLLLKRGCHWEGGLTIPASAGGVSVQPYGKGPEPVLLGEGISRERGVVLVLAAGAQITGLHVVGAAGAGIEIRGPNAEIDDAEIEGTAFGVVTFGRGTTVRRTRAHDLKMFVDTPGGTDDTGAVGFVVQADDALIVGSSCVNCRAPSHDFGYDGGFAEVFDHGDRLQLIGNTARNAQGFLEVGGVAPDGSAHDILLAQNTVDDAHGGVWVHGNDRFSIPAGDISLLSNRFVTSTGEPFLGGVVGALRLTDNAFVTPGSVSLSGAPFTSTDNRYYLRDPSRLGFPAGPGDRVAPLSSYR